MMNPSTLMDVSASAAAPGPPAAPQAADTVVMTVARDGFDLLCALAHGLVVATFLVLLVVAFFVFWQVRKARRALSELQRKVEAEPILMRARGVAKDAEFIAGSVRREVEKFNASVSSLSDRLNQASDRMEERIEEFNALMEVVQSEAEDVFVNTASTMRGMRAGAQRLRRDGGRRRLRPAPHGAGNRGTAGKREPAQAREPTPEREEGAGTERTRGEDEERRAEGRTPVPSGRAHDETRGGESAREESRDPTTESGDPGGDRTPGPREGDDGR